MVQLPFVERLQCWEVETPQASHGRFREYVVQGMRVRASEIKDVIPEEMSQCDQLKTSIEHVGSDERFLSPRCAKHRNCDTRHNEGRDTPSRSRGAPSRRGKVKRNRTSAEDG